MLDETSVSVKREKYIEMDGSQMSVGGIVRNAYMNTSTGRQQLKDNLPLEFYTAVISVWGNAPLVENTAE